GARGEAVSARRARVAIVGIRLEADAGVEEHLAPPAVLAAGDLPLGLHVAEALDDSSAHARETLPDPGKMSTSVSPCCMPSARKSQLQNEIGLRPTSDEPPWRATAASSASRTPGRR